MGEKSHFLILSIFLIKITLIVNNKTMCNFLTYCDDCIKCGNDSKNYSKCNYTNLFCKSKTNQLIYFPKLLREYIYNFRVVQKTKKYCGRPEILFNHKENFIELNFGKNIESYLLNNSLHCNYIRFTDFFPYFYNYDIEFELMTNKNSSLSFDVILTYGTNKNSGIEHFSSLDFTSNQKKFSLRKVYSFMILIDFHKNSFLFNGTLKIKIINLTKNMLPLSRKNSFRLLFRVVPFFLFFFITSMISICFVNRLPTINNNYPRLYSLNNYIGRSNNIFSNRNEQRKNKNKLKIKNLFQTILAPKIFQQSDLVNDCVCCTICLENFEDKKSIISITTCNHIFHFNCLKKWAYKNILNFKCPICKKDLIPDDNINERDVRIIDNSENIQTLELDSIADLLNINNFV